MPRTDVAFQTSDGVTLRGWFFTPDDIPRDEKLPCLVTILGFSCVKEMIVPQIASRLTSKLPMACLVFDHRGFGCSDTLPGQARQEIIPAQQCSDVRDAITYCQMREEVDKDKIGLWGYSYGGGHALYVSAVDRRVKATISVAPTVDGWENFLRLVRIDIVEGMNQAFEADRISRAKGNSPICVPIVSADPNQPCGLPSRESYKFFSEWEVRSSWKNEVTLRSVEEIRAYNLPLSHIKHITPTPVLMVVATKDTNTPPDMSMRAYGELSEPKQLFIADGDHYEILGRCLGAVLDQQVDFLQRTLCK